MMTDQELADELVRQATLIRLGQKTFSTRAKLLLTATFFDNDYCDYEGRVCKDAPTRPKAMFTEINILEESRHGMNAWNPSPNPAYYRARDPEIEFTLRVFDPRIHPRDIVNRSAAYPHTAIQQIAATFKSYASTIQRVKPNLDSQS